MKIQKNYSAEETKITFLNISNCNRNDHQENLQSQLRNWLDILKQKLGL